MQQKQANKVKGAKMGWGGAVKDGESWSELIKQTVTRR